MTEPAPAAAHRTHRGLGARAVRRRAPRRPGVRRRPPPSPAGPARASSVVYCMVTSGEAGIDGHAPRRVPRRSARPSRSSPRGSSASTRSTSSGSRTASWSTASALRRAIADGRSGGTAPTSSSPTTSATPGAARNLNQADHIATGKATARRRTRRRQPLGLPRAAGRRARAVGRRPRGVGRRRPRTRRTPSTSPRRSTAGVASLRAHQAYIDGLGLGRLRPRRVPRGDDPGGRAAARRRARGQRSRCSRWAGATEARPLRGLTRPRRSPSGLREAGAVPEVPANGELAPRNGLGSAAVS